ncbi:ankyrin repeat domain-containing protein [Pseudobacteriovorax antillogorgiicola]|uniref:Ankyrin repeat-containing protein n=1 Tax=Pseudobacteriovorax antillogorgiicola TaxID=1513793 RepID=A0A1Y6CQV6_9BACT|nr:ankyrin repeat domain-containing protein [Pseudobacteriovorax antillogorgiicola]TCS41888.1 hypothetical protein EDD56_1452 [Pseudobacteriovorax antillogorgiicola]SMF83199.1 hypothetical protein SAMN06296036_14510 [Pseudobacteriovorax antillogorgiicola]
MNKTIVMVIIGVLGVILLFYLYFPSKDEGEIICRGKIEEIRKIVASPNFDPNQYIAGEWTPLTIVSEIFCSGPVFPKVKLLLENGANPNMPDKAGRLPLFSLIQSFVKPTGEDFQERKIDLKDPDLKTSVDLLLGAGANPFARDSFRGKSIVDYAEESELTDLQKWFDEASLEKNK